ncbi:RelA/SpoT family protein [Leptolyngbya sp. 7M]|uniref:RelA/SpoT family protein n=1 Tax=Leptolyngbya sp. 7M TaxID=2812896 RepID=UPI001B8A9053|nr:TGS domain-containing protein [Leptolyngbya sp. 7M]QYO67742.1 TGS domain-containing protein [Leptolyngbya sp. 7M]
MQSALKLKASSPSAEKFAFPVDGQLLMVLPRAAASIKNPDVHLPILRSDEEGYYLEMQVEADSKETSEVAVIRRVPLENLSAEEWEELKAQYAKLDLQACTDQGISKGLEKIQDRKIQRLFMALLTFLNPRQVSIVLYLYKLAAQQGNGPIVSFRSNDLLERLGYTRTKDGGFASKLRSQLNRGYQSLHTVVIGNTGRPLEVQIRTLEMHHVAEYGIAAHWKYKEAGNSYTKLSTDDEKFTWLRQLLEWQNDLKDAQEYLESVKGNLFDDDVYVFTPGGDVIALAQGSTPIDFAYRIHTEVGNHCAGAKVNDRMVTLDTPLKNGDIVEIITQKNSHPSLDWLNFAVTPGAKNRIRQWYKRSHRDANILRGRELLEKELGKRGFEALLKSEPMQATAERCNYQSPEDLLAALGYGEVTLNLVLNRLREAIKARQPIVAVPKEESTNTLLHPATSNTPVQPVARSKTSPIVGVEGLLYSLAGCCNPVPGESIIGVVTMGGRGISIHRQGCSNTENVPGERLIPVSWNTTEGSSRPQTYPVQVQIEVIDRVGVLKDILSRLSDYNINVRSAQVKTFPGQTAVINLGIDIIDHEQLERIFTQIRKMSDVLQLRRISQVDEQPGG